MIPLALFRAIRREIPDRETRLAILRAKSGVAGMFRFDPSRGRIEVNSVEFAVRCMAIKWPFTSLRVQTTDNRRVL